MTQAGNGSRSVGRTRASGHPPSERARTEIMTAAAKLFSQRGTAGTSMDGIAEAAGLRTPSLYHYFKNKQDIVESLTAYGVGELAAFATTVTTETGSAVERLHRLLVHHVSHLTSAPFDLWFLLGPSAVARGSEEAHAQGDLWRSVVHDLIVRGMANGELRELEPTFALDLAVGCSRAALDRRHRGLDVDPVATADFVIIGLGGTPPPRQEGSAGPAES